MSVIALYWLQNTAGYTISESQNFLEKNCRKLRPVIRNTRHHLIIIIWREIIELNFFHFYVNEKNLARFATGNLGCIPFMKKMCCRLQENVN